MPGTDLVRRIPALLAALAVGLFGALSFAAPAAATTHAAPATATLSCENGKVAVRWSIRNGWPDVADVSDVSSKPAGVALGGTELDGKGDKIIGKQLVPTSTETATLNYTVRWADRATAAQTASKTIPGDVCSEPAPKCIEAADASYQHSFDGTKGTATVALLAGQKLCKGSSQDFSLASYTATSAGGGYASALPQQLFRQQTRTVSARHPSVTLRVAVPDCYTQVVLIWGDRDEVLTDFRKGTPSYGAKVLGHGGAPGNRSIGPLGSFHGGRTACVVSVTDSASPSASAAPAPVHSAPASSAAAAAGSASSLPVTGGSLAAVIVAVVVLAGGGLVLFVTARRRRVSPTDR
ncbi:hypothetical protein [Actinocatenispora thailandica]|uniref:hypothetical protein n=1 Tax=Actinocatenispora thailandica TaxID=227318 RepID=UPI00195047A2|nr:hypothetical protein [Actinocatenispora thailandica]